MTAEVLRLLLILVTAIVGVGLGGGPAVLTALVATALAWYRTDVGRWVVDPAVDGPAIAAFAATAIVVAVTAGARRGAAVSARWLQRELEAAAEDAEARQETIARLTAETAALRAESTRTAGELASARAAADRAERSRKAILDSLPPELRAPHVMPPAALQLFPPLLAAAPIGIAPPPVGPAAADEVA
ncbi:hypothetical protein J421_5445 (plasmid) [Gemmatirosa kalamazoonensis]|uniref:Uncharacterized protein n=1 Tax=Gemmatirosa kalamazoonensis TaxID=861299 RepID=W0RRM8_9BACT|nr:hypothetical protein J421_5445 [Gemmatirosa kalamazoonensis]